MLSWKVYVGDFNRDQIVIYDIFKNGVLEEKLKKIKKDCKTKEEFLEEIDFELRYLFWSKCEWEIILSSWPPYESFKAEKIDVYHQLKMNWNVFSDYVWNNL